MLTLVIAAVAAVAYGLLRGGSLEALAYTRFTAPWLVFAGFGVQIGAQLWSPDWIEGGVALAVIFGSNALIAAFLVLNRRYRGSGLALVGLLLNLLVIGANGAMPVSEHAAEIAGVEKSLDEAGLKHERMDDDTRLPWFGDAIPVPGLVEVLSLGDVVLNLGLVRLLYGRVTWTKRRGRHGVGVP